MVPRHQASTGIMAKFLGRYHISLTGRYVGSRFVGSDTANALSPLKPYFVMDGRMAYEVKNLEVYLQANNMLGERYSTYASSFGTTKYFYPAPEENYNLGINIMF
jgi:outer membrane receptor protein involved in Fe transport